MLTTWHPLSTNVGTNFADMRSLSRYTSSSLSDSGPRVFFFLQYVKVVGRIAYPYDMQLEMEIVYFEG
jgi:hypothetical protein